MVEVVVFEKLLHEPAGALLSMEDGVRVRVLLAIMILLSIISTLDGRCYSCNPLLERRGSIFRRRPGPLRNGWYVHPEQTLGGDSLRA